MFRFTIRELILLTVIVAMGAAWWVDRRQLSTLNAESLRSLAEAVKYEYETKYPARSVSIIVNGREVRTIAVD